MMFHTWLREWIHVICLSAELLWLLALAYVTSDGARSFLIDYGMFVVGCGAATVIWCVGGVGHLLRRPSGRIRYLVSMSWPLWWVREPFVMAAALVLVLTPITFYVRLGLSARPVAQAAETILSTDASPATVSYRQLGVFFVREVDRADGAVRFITGGCGIMDSCGFVYCPEGTPPRVGSDSYRHLWGPWWHWYQSS